MCTIYVRICAHEKMSYQYEEELPPEARSRYLTKIKLVGCETCPYKVPADLWINDPKQWPNIEYNDVYNYLIKHPRVYSSEAMDNYRSLDAHIFFVSGWVQTIEHIKSASGQYIFKANVKPSWRVTEEPHHPWVAVTKNGPVSAAHCDCMAGLGETCSHIGAVLFKMEAAVRLGYTASACTDVPCMWNACFVKNVEPAKVADIRFYKKESKLKLSKSTKKIKPMPEPATDIEQQQFVSALASLDENVVGLSIFKEYSDRFVGLGPDKNSNKLPPPLRSLYQESNRRLTDAEVAALCDITFNNLSITKAEVMYVDEVTITQASSSTWHDQRAGRITSSVAFDAMHANLLKPAPSVIKKLCIPQSRPLRVPAIMWGNEHEVDAFHMYSNMHTDAGSLPDCIPNGQVYMIKRGPHKSATVEKAGFLICHKQPFLGASPDGYINCECCGRGILEIKCPFKYRETVITKAFEDASFCLNNDFSLKEGHKYFAQVQLQMHVGDVAYTDLFIWTTVDCVITRIVRNQVFINNMMARLEAFWKTAVLPEILTRRLELGQTVGKENISSRAYCICRTTSNLSNMVGCDHCDDWFQAKCLNLQRLPTTKKWYCPMCRKSMKKVNR